MKEKELITFYKIFANLYGAILDKDAFEIITQYFPDFSYEDFISSLKKASKKHDRTYSVRKWDKDSYVIRSNINNKETRQLFFWQAKKPFFTCPNFEDFKKYVFYLNINKHTDPILKKISKLCVKYFDYYNGDFANSLAFAVAEDTQIMVLRHVTPLDAIRGLIIDNGINLSDSDQEEYLNLYNELRANTRTWEDRGHTADEIEDLYYNPQKYREFVSSIQGLQLANL